MHKHATGTFVPSCSPSLLTRGQKVALCATLVLTLIGSPFSRAESEWGDSSPPPALALMQIAETLDVAPDELEIVDVVDRFLLTSGNLQQVKVSVSGSNQTSVHYFRDGELVAGLEIIEQDRAAYRASHGALHPLLQELLAANPTQDEFDVGIWALGTVTPLPRPTAESIAAGDSMAEYRRRAIEHLGPQASDLLAPIVEQLSEFGVEPTYASTIAPLVYATIDRAQLLTLARHPNVDTIYGPNDNRDALDTANPAHKGDVVAFWGFDGTGASVAIVEDSRVEFGNPHLNAGATRVPGDPNVDDHATATAGIVASLSAAAPGLAPGASLYSANATSYASADIAAALDWASLRDIINNSWSGNANSRLLNDHDRHCDYLVRHVANVITTAAGNQAGSCDTMTGYVTSPGKAYNGITVGAIGGSGTVTWDDDDMLPCSSHIDPITGAEKPEVVAQGGHITSTMSATPWLDDAGSGTSFASPMVAGLAANIEDVFPFWPERVKAIILATALQNVTGNSHHSNVDGTGGIDARAGVYVASKQWGWQGSLNAADFPRDELQYCEAGERVRAVVCWDSNPDSGYTVDPLEADLDLRVYGPSGTLVASSLSLSDPFEIVEFVAPESGDYRFEVDAASFAGASEYVALAVFPGSKRLQPDEPRSLTGVSTPPNQLAFDSLLGWNVVALQPTGSSLHHLHLFDGSPWEDPADRELLVSSTMGNQLLDFVVMDRNHLPHGDRYPGVERVSGDETRIVEAADRQADLIDGTYGPYPFGPQELVDVFDFQHETGVHRYVRVAPNGGDIDFRLFLFASDSSDSSTWTQSRLDHLLTVNDGAAGEPESFDFYSLAVSDWYGLVIANVNFDSATTPTNYRVFVDSSEPIANVAINDGSQHTGSPRVLVSIDTEDVDTGIQRVRFREVGTATWILAFETPGAVPNFSGSFELDLTPGSGPREVVVEVENGAGMTKSFVDAITLYPCPQPGGPLDNGFFQDTTGFPWCFEDESTNGLVDFSAQYAQVRGGDDGSGMATSSYIRQWIDVPSGDYLLEFVWTFTTPSPSSTDDLAFWDLVNATTGLSLVGGPHDLANTGGTAGQVSVTVGLSTVAELRLGTHSLDNLGGAAVSEFDNVSLTPVQPPGRPFLRGDCNMDGALQITDVIYTLAALFSGGPQPCPDACDANDDGSVQIADPVFITEYLFSSGPPPAAPFPNVGQDPTADALGCPLLP